MKLISVIMLALTLAIAGCGNRDNLSPFSPRAQMKQQLQNQNGKIGELETLNNAQKNEIGKLQSEAEVHARDIAAMQQGTLNRANSGVQVLSGDGILVVVVVLGTLGIALAGFAIYYHNQAAKSQKAAAILARHITYDPALEDSVCRAALRTDVTNEVCSLLVQNRHKCPIHG